MKDDQRRQLLDRTGQAPRRVDDAERIEALMESYAPVWPDIHDRAVNSPDHFQVPDTGLGNFRDDASGGPGEDRIAGGVIRLPTLPTPIFAPCLLSLCVSAWRRTGRASSNPACPAPADKPPSGSNWIHEIKHDGYRHNGPP